MKPKDATTKTVTWKSNNTKVAKVDKTGVVTAVGKGNATITCTAKDGSKKSATCKITVTEPVKVKKLTLEKTKITLKKGKTATLKVIVSPSNATNKEVSYESSNKKVATVVKNGKITAKKTRHSNHHSNREGWKQEKSHLQGDREVKKWKYCKDKCLTKAIKGAISFKEIAPFHMPLQAYMLSVFSYV